ncbi:Norsolorinic acid ketoreductase, partial [Lachnellula occidentalis]
SLYLAKPHHTVIAAVRSPSSPSTQALTSLPTGTSSRLITVKIDACIEGDAAAAVESLRTNHGISYIDVVVANAGVSYVFPKVSELRIEDLMGHMTPNVFGLVWLYQATLPLLLRAGRPRWVTMGSVAGSIESQPPMNNAAYGPSKATAHWLTKRMHSEEATLAAFVTSPGWCQTDMGNSGAKAFGLEEAPVSVETSCGCMVELIEGASREGRGGRMWGYEGDLMAW